MVVPPIIAWKGSVTISANVPSSMNGGPVDGSKGNIQFGSITEFPAASRSTPQISQPTASAPIERTIIQISANPKAPLLQKLPENHSTIVDRDQLSSSSKCSATKKKRNVEKMSKEPTRKDNKASNTTELARSAKASEHNTPVPYPTSRESLGSRANQDYQPQPSITPPYPISLGGGVWNNEPTKITNAKSRHFSA
jgi:hypothetical protein